MPELWIRNHWIRIRHSSASESGSNPDPGFWWPTTEEKKYSRKFWNIFLIKNCNLFMSKLKEKPSALKRKHPALQKMKFINCFPCLWVIFASWIRIHSTALGVCITLMRIRILLLIKGMRICDKWPKDSPCLHLKPPHLHFEPRKLMNFDSNADPDPAYKNNSDPDTRPCFILSVSKREEETGFKRLTTVNCRVHPHT